MPRLGPDKLVALPIQDPGYRPVNGLFIFNDKDSSFHIRKRLCNAWPAGGALAGPRGDAPRLTLGLCRALVIAGSLAVVGHNHFPRQCLAALLFIKYLHFLA